jgi:hypothetical protein
MAARTEALAHYGTPDISNTDQDRNLRRLWRTLNYDHIYLNPADSGTTCREGISAFLNY